MFGYPCSFQNDVEQAFLPVLNSVIIVKDNNGSVYLPEYNFNGLGNLISGEGYQAKVTTPINDFTFCEGVMFPNLEELNINENSQQIDSLETTSFYLGILNENQYNLTYWEESVFDPLLPWGDIYVDVEIISPEEFVNALYIGFIGVNVNGVQRYTGSSNWVASKQMTIGLTNWRDYLYNGDRVEITYTTSKGMFTIQDVFDATFSINNIQQNGCNEFEFCPYNIFLEYDSLADMFSEDCCKTLIIYGCTEYSALNYNELANLDNGTCEHIYGCTDSLASNYNSEATSIDETCIYYGCTDELAGNYDELANTDDGSCLIGGCMNITAENYNYEAQTDDGSCIIYGCTIDLFPNFNPVANTGNNSCDMNSNEIYGCTDNSVLNYNNSANIDNGTCNNFAKIGDEILGGIVFYVDTSGQNGLIVSKEDLLNSSGQEYFNNYGFDLSNLNTQEDEVGSGIVNTDILQSIVPAATAALSYESDEYSDWYLPSSYELEMLFDNLQPLTEIFSNFFSNHGTYLSSTIYGNSGLYVYNYYEDCCPTMIGYITYDEYAGVSVRPIKTFGNWIMGCTTPLACNYNPQANMTDGSCEYVELGYDCEGNFIEYVIGMEAQGGIVFYIDETGEHGLVANIEDLGQFEWGCYDENVDGADGEIIGSGYQNTMDIVNQGCITYNGGVTAAQAALNFDSDGYNDWFLPSIDELTEMMDNIGPNSDISYLNYLIDDAESEVLFWSSSEYDNSLGYAFIIENGDEVFYELFPKDEQLHVRPIRSF